MLPVSPPLPTACIFTLAPSPRYALSWSSRNWFFQRTWLVYLEYGGRRLIRNVNRFLPLHWARSHNNVFVIILISLRIFKLLKILHLCSWKERKLKISTGLSTCLITIWRTQYELSWASDGKIRPDDLTSAVTSVYVWYGSPET